MLHQTLKHDSVLQNEVIESLLHPSAASVFDGTLGLGGHANLILKTYPNIKLYIGTDLDGQHLAMARQNLDTYKDKFIGIEANFSAISEVNQSHPLPRPTCILLDLGVCSNHLDDETKGFSHQADGPLHMAFSTNQEYNCEKILNEESVAGLTKIMREFGEEPAAHRIALKIVAAREAQPLTRTSELKEIIEKSVHPRDRKKALTRVFQAFRMATNQELHHLTLALDSSFDLMETGDRIGVMSYHSLEDRVVKRQFQRRSRPKTEATKFSLHETVEPAEINLITKKPVSASLEEIERNPRSRSVKFRIAEKL
jgi:16S rRNA (cytosine1402-N4)-methyltransferase